MTHAPVRPPAMRLAPAVALLLALASPTALAAEREFSLFLHDQGSAGPEGGRLHLLPEEIRAEIGDTLRISVTNSGSTIHDVQFCGDGQDPSEACEKRWGGTRMLQPNETANLLVELPEAGRFDYYCSVPGHKGGGMRGTLVVAGASEEKSGVPLGPVALAGLVAAALVARRLRP